MTCWNAPCWSVLLSPFSFLLLLQLNVFYNVRSEEQTRGRSHGTRRHEAFHLHVELNDVDLNSAHLLICAR